MTDTNRHDAITYALEYLAQATQAEPDGGMFDTYRRGLDSFETATITEACLRLAESEKRMPPLAVVRAMCREVLSVVVAQTDAIKRTDTLTYEPLPQARAKMWKDHLAAVLQAKRRGEEPPPAPVALDSTDPRSTFRCHACLDAKWVFGECKGGSARTCGRPDTNRYVAEDKKAYFLAACRVPHTFARRCHCA